jgi:hypothetical protein
MFRPIFEMGTSLICNELPLVPSCSVVIMSDVYMRIKLLTNVNADSEYQVLSISGE